MVKNALSEEDRARQRTVKFLIMHVGRAFYDTQFIVVLDQLARHEVLKDDDLAGRVGLTGKDLGKLMGRLQKDGLVMCYRQNTNRTGETLGRITSKGYYYIDHGSFCNVVKWRISEMRRMIDTKLRNELALQGFVCPQCRKTFETLDIAHLMRPGGLFCDQCDGELVDNMHLRNDTGKDDRMQRFNAQTQWIRDGLRKTEDMTMPKVDIQDWIRRHPPATAAGEGEVLKDDGLAIAGTGPSTKQEQVYDIVFTNDDSMAAEKAQRDKEARAKRQQNALPAWHTASTITGQMTAFGLANKEAELNANSMIHEEISDDMVIDDSEETKNSLEMYYANLEAESRASQASTPGGLESDYLAPDSTGLAIPIGSGSTLHRAYSSMSMKRKRDLAMGADEEGGAPKHSRNNSYQNSQAPSPLNRSQSRESSGSSGSSDGWGGNNGVHMGAADANGQAMQPRVGKDPMVSVNGIAIPLSQVSEEHYDLMTPEEYEKYFEVLAAQG